MFTRRRPIPDAAAFPAESRKRRQFARSLSRRRPALRRRFKRSISARLESALKEEPGLGAKLTQGSVVMPLENYRLPDFSGKSVREVARMCSRLGVKLKVIGTGRAVAQRPLAGSAVYDDTVCEVYFNFQPSAQRVSLEPDRVAAGN